MVILLPRHERPRVTATGGWRGHNSRSLRNNSNAEYFDVVQNKSTENLVVIDFFATWCGSYPFLINSQLLNWCATGPCRAIAPIMEGLSKEFTNVSFYKIDVDDYPAVAKDADVRSMPTFLFFKGGEKADQVIGANASALRARSLPHSCFCPSIRIAGGADMLYTGCRREERVEARRILQLHRGVLFFFPLHCICMRIESETYPKQER